jgi:putative addiction module component (TIGR02574 family)
MPTQLEALGLQNLNTRERLELIETLWNSLPETVQAEELPDWHLAEIARRRADAAAHPGIGRSWRDVIDEVGAGS